MRFFFDNCISSNLTTALRLIDDGRHEIEHLTDRFDEGTKDEVWIPKIAADRGLIIVSADPAITTAKKQKEVWRSVRLTSFFFGAGFTERHRVVQAAELLRLWPDICRLAQESSAGTGYLMPFKSKAPQKFFEPLK